MNRSIPGRLLFTALILNFFSCNGPQQEPGESANHQIMQIERENFGVVDSTTVYLYTLRNEKGMEVSITNFGGIVTSIKVPDKNGEFADIVLGFDSLTPYTGEHPYFGCIVGRYANRIARGSFVLEGKTYTLATNNGPNHLHGGLAGFDKKIWKATDQVKNDTASLILEYTSPDGEEGYPGNLSVVVKYSLNNQNELIVSYRATTDAPTPVNLTQHSYFNLAGAGNGDILGHIMMIDADRYTEVDETLIPTGNLPLVEGTPMDFRKPEPIGSRIDQVTGGYDHNYVLNNEGEMRVVARVMEPESGRTLEVLTTEPGIQFYSGNFLDGSITGKQGKTYFKHYGFCLETQHFPDSPNQPGFPDAILEPGEDYKYTAIFRFSVQP
ncbi:MAG: galactose mutarotase [Bacteroidetes bacterium]|nr:galactose mutarotase [Bacteroidota bacterium]